MTSASGGARRRLGPRLIRLGPWLIRLGPWLIRLIPAPLRPRLAQLSRPLARYLAAAKFRRKYADRFVSRIHPQDDLLHYSIEVASAQPGPFRYYRGVQMYLGGGEWNAAEVEKVLGDVGLSLGHAGSLLEFACGYGRLTRHLVHRIDRSRVTVSDIDRQAVDFVTREFGVRGFYSAATAQELIHEVRYDLIVVVSLFSHLPIQHWGPWLKRLSALLTADGVLSFSTLGRHAYDVNVSRVDREAFQTQAPGFLYREENETRGRLPGEHYGVAYVGQEYVARALSEHFAGRLLAVCPRALNGFQDVYVAQRASTG